MNTNDNIQVPQQQKRKKKSLGNSRLQNYRRKFRKQVLPRHTNKHHDDNSVVNTIEQIENHSMDDLTLINSTVNYSIMPDAIFLEMYLNAFNESGDIINFTNDEQKIQFLRQYTYLIDRLYYVQLQHRAWHDYSDFGNAENVWKGRIPKYQADKYSICHTYGRSKRIVQQRLQQFKQQVQTVQLAIQQFEAEILAKAVQHDICVTVMQKLGMIIYQFVQQKQKRLQMKLEYEQKMFRFNVTDHELFHKFFDLRPNKSQVIKKLVSFSHIHSFISMNFIDDFCQTYLGSN